MCGMIIALPEHEHPSIRVHALFRCLCLCMVRHCFAESKESRSRQSSSAAAPGSQNNERIQHSTAQQTGNRKHTHTHLSEDEALISLASSPSFITQSSIITTLTKIRMKERKKKKGWGQEKGKAPKPAAKLLSTLSHTHRFLCSSATSKQTFFLPRFLP